MSEQTTAVVSRDPAAEKADFLRQYEAGDLSPTEAREGATGVPAYLSYIWFKTQNEELKEQIKATGATLPTFILTRAGHRQAVKPFKYHMFHSTTIATKNDPNGKIVDAEARIPQLPKEEMKAWSEHTFAVVAVVDGDFLTPAFINLRGGARKALSYAITATDDAKDNRWAGKGKAFEAAVAATNIAPGRVISVGSVAPEKSETTGYHFLSGKCSWVPSSTEDLARFVAAVSRPQFFLDLQATSRVYNARLKTLLAGGMEEASDE